METYEPNYLMWWEKDFSADTYVSRVMRPLHRHFYRALIIASCFNSLRPYLPNDDEQLWVLADAESLEQWMAHKDVVMRKFTLCPSNDNLWQHKRILADWQLMLDAHQKNVEKGRKGGKKKASNAKAPSGEAQAPSSPTTAQPSRTEAQPSTMNLTMNYKQNSTQHNTDRQTKNERAVGPSVVCVSDSESLSPKSKSNSERWTEFVMSKEAGLPEEMKYAVPTDEERDSVLEQLDVLGAEKLGMAIDEWVDVQSPPLSGLKFHRWKRWLETGGEKFEDWKDYANEKEK